MGKEKYQKKIKELFEKSPVVSFNSIKRIINSSKNKKQYPKQLIRNLIIKNRIKKLTKGYYTLHDDPSLAVFSLNPAYLGLQDALSIHDIWEQETIPIIITTKKIRPGIRCINGSNVLIRRIEKKYFFGLTYKKQGDINLPYSDIEKTLIDMVYFKEKINKELIVIFKKKIDEKRLNSYLKNYPILTRKKVLNVLK